VNWNACFADRTRHMRRTAVRELLKLTSQPGMISFAGGLPAAELFPLDRIREAANTVLARVGRSALQYGETEGTAELRDWVAARFSTNLVRVHRSNVLIVSGGQQALDLIGRVLLNAGDRVLVENPTYLALLSAWRPSDAEFSPVPCDEQGLCVSHLSSLLAKRPKLIYLVPNFQNPQGTTLSLDRRLDFIRLLSETDVGVVEDNPYGALRYENDPLPHLYTLGLSRSGNANQGRVIHVGTFSKILVPGLRVGFVVAPEPVIEALVRAKQAADLHTSTFAQHLVSELVQSDFLDQHLSLLRHHYRQRRDAMLTALGQHLPENVTWSRPEGGMFLLVTVPDGVDVQKLLKFSIERQVAFVPGEEFHLEGDGRNTLRLNFSNANPERIEEGIGRLGVVLKEAIISDRDGISVP
jgi:2-aminoadipate transaminase